MGICSCTRSDSVLKVNIPAPNQNTKNLEELIIDISQFKGLEESFILQNYDILKKLDSGTFGQVYLALHKKTNEFRAIKTIPKKYLNASEKSVFNEFEILKNLDHPNILQVLEYYIGEKVLCLVSEFCKGGSLIESINQFAGDEEKSSIIIKQILLALSYLHKNNVVHRDIKPENIMFPNSKSDLMIKVIDFGSAQLTLPGIKLKRKTGSLYYMAPEVFHGQYSFPCDIWSCGVLLYLLISGDMLFPGKHDKDMLEYFERDFYQTIDDKLLGTSEELRDLLRKMLTKNPSKRIKITAALQHPWFIKFSNLDESPTKKRKVQILQNFDKFQSFQKFELAIYTLLSTLFRFENEKGILTETFNRLDVNGDGSLTVDELIHGYRNIFGISKSDEEIRLIFEALDYNKNNQIDFSEFMIAFLKTSSSSITKEKFKKVFNIFDQNGDGFIDISEFKRIFKKDHQMPEEIVEQLFKQADFNHDSKITFEEFLSIMSTQQDQEFQRRQDTIHEEVEEEKRSQEENQSDLSLRSFYESIKVENTKGANAKEEAEEEVNQEMVFDEERRKTLSKKSKFFELQQNENFDQETILSPASRRKEDNMPEIFKLQGENLLFRSNDETNKLLSQFSGSFSVEGDNSPKRTEIKHDI